MRSILPPGELAHNWAHYPVSKKEQRRAKQLAKDGENTYGEFRLPGQSDAGMIDDACTAGNISFYRGVFRSYGTCIAQKVLFQVNGKEELVHVVSSTTYSPTTTSHQNFVYGALPYGATVVYVAGGWRDHNLFHPTCRATQKRQALGYIKALLAEANALKEAAARRRVPRYKESDLASAAKLLKNAHELKRLTGLRISLSETVDEVDTTLARFTVKEERDKRRRIKVNIKRVAAWRAKEQEHHDEADPLLETWILGKDVPYKYAS